MNFRHFLATGALCLLAAGAAYAQEPTKPELNSLPPDRPVLDPTPQAPAPTPSAPTPTAPAPAPGVFQPARPPQPAAQPAPATRPTPANVGNPVTTPAQVAEPGPSKWFVAGNPTLRFGSVAGNGYFSGGLAALLGRRLTDRIALGPGFTYQYTSIGSTSFSNLGLRVFGQVLILDNIFLHVEQEAMRTEVPDFRTIPFTTKSQNVNSTFAGGGYRSRIGSRAALDVMLLYNFNQLENYYLYGPLDLRFYFTFDIFRGK